MDTITTEPRAEPRAKGRKAAREPPAGAQPLLARDRDADALAEHDFEAGVPVRSPVIFRFVSFVPLTLCTACDAFVQVGAGQRLAFLCGTIESGARVLAFERVLWRATRGNMYLRVGDGKTKRALGAVDANALLLICVCSLLSGPSEERCVFMVVYAGNTVHTKVTKICEAFSAHV